MTAWLNCPLAHLSIVLSQSSYGHSPFPKGRRELGRAVRTSHSTRMSRPARTVDCRSRYTRGQLFSNKLALTAVYLTNDHVLSRFSI